MSGEPQLQCEPPKRRISLAELRLTGPTTQTPRHQLTLSVALNWSLSAPWHPESIARSLPRLAPRGAKVGGPLCHGRPASGRFTARCLNRHPTAIGFFICGGTNGLRSGNCTTPETRGGPSSRTGFRALSPFFRACDFGPLIS